MKHDLPQVEVRCQCGETLTVKSVDPGRKRLQVHVFPCEPCRNNHWQAEAQLIDALEGGDTDEA